MTKSRRDATKNRVHIQYSGTFYRVFERYSGLVPLISSRLIRRCHDNRNFHRTQPTSRRHTPIIFHCCDRFSILDKQCDAGTRTPPHNKDCLGAKKRERERENTRGRSSMGLSMGMERGGRAHRVPVLFILREQCGACSTVVNLARLSARSRVQKKKKGKI